MRIHQTDRGFVILRGVRTKQFFAFFVDGDRASWTNSEHSARIYESRDAAVSEMQEIMNLRRNPKDGQATHA